MLRKKSDKQILFERMNKVAGMPLNEDVFNDAGEPQMTHQQYRDYGEPEEPEYDDSDNPEMEQNFDSIVKDLENRFNTYLYGDSNNKNFFSRGHDIMLYDEKGKLVLYIDTEKKYEGYMDETDVDELVNLIKPYENTIPKGEAAEKEINSYYADAAADRHYASQERAAMGVEENKNNDNKSLLFERMNKVAGMPKNENYPMGAENDPRAPWNQTDDEEDEYEPDPDEKYDSRMDD